jgi:hypothetical protein
MKNRLYSIAISVLFLIPFVAPWEGGHTGMVGQATRGVRFDAAAPGSQDAAIFMPVLDTDTSDLDVRDSHNRPVRSVVASQSMSELFMDSLFNLAVVDSLHGINQIWSDLELFSRLFHNLIYNIFYPLQQAIPKVWQPPTKRFVHNVHNLWISLSVGMFMSMAMFLIFSAKPSCQKIILRC